jgi:hypothetical protein
MLNGMQNYITITVAIKAVTLVTRFAAGLRPALAERAPAARRNDINVCPARIYSSLAGAASVNPVTTSRFLSPQSGVGRCRRPGVSCTSGAAGSVARFTGRPMCAGPPEAGSVEESDDGRVEAAGCCSIAGSSAGNGRHCARRFAPPPTGSRTPAPGRGLIMACPSNGRAGPIA